MREGGRDESELNAGLPSAQALGQIAPEVVIEELAAVVAIEAQEPKRQGPFHVLRGRQHPCGALVPDRPAFRPAAENVGIRKAPDEVASQAGSAVRHAVGFQISWLSQIPRAGPNGDLRLKQTPRLGPAAAPPGILGSRSTQEPIQGC